MSKKYLKLIGIQIGDMESEIKVERNFPDTEAGAADLNAAKKEAEEKGYVCLTTRLDVPNL